MLSGFDALRTVEIKYYSLSLITEERETSFQRDTMPIVFYRFVEYDVTNTLDLYVQQQLWGRCRGEMTLPMKSEVSGRVSKA